MFVPKINRNNLLILSVVSALNFFAVYFFVSRAPVSVDNSGALLPLDPVPSKTMVLGNESKTRSSSSPKEYVDVDGQRFEIMPPWTGHMIVQGERDDLRLEMVPRELVFENRKIYVTHATRDAFIRMAEAASLDDVLLLADSGYRSVEYQKKIYRRKMAEGEDFYDIARWVAPPGYSEHMLGTTLDMVPSNWTFSETAADKWLRENGTRFSFVQSYPRTGRDGFAWEPWHWKYVGDS